MLDDSFRIRYKSIPVAKSEINNFWPAKIHNHNEFEVLSIKEGACIVRIGNKDYYSKKGDMIFINPMEVHEIEICEDAPHLHQCVCFDVSLIMNGQLGDELKDECTSIVHHIDGESEYAEHLRELFDKIFVTLTDEDKTSSMDITAYITLMFSYLLRNSFVDKTRNNPKQTKFCKNVIEYIKEHYCEKLTSKQVAETMFFNHSYFCRKFRENFGISFSTYLNIYRISLARIMLEENGNSVEYVSCQCGFDTPTYFSKCFKEYVGVLPREYKKGKNSL